MKRKLTYKIIQTLLLCAGCIPLNTKAQKQDSLAPLRAFLQISSAYKQTPLYLEMEMKNTSNFITEEQDTLIAAGTFYILPESLYMQFGEVEQLITDSIAILVSSRMQRIMLNTTPGLLRNQMEVFAGSLVKDSSLTALSKRYRGQSKENGTIELNSRNLLYTNAPSRETIEMHYDAKTMKPTELISVRRTLVPLSDEDHQRLSSQPDLDKFLLAVEDKGYFLIKEQTTSFIYKKVRQEASIKIPVTLSDRVVKNKKGEFEPVKAYKDYVITTN